ncbi:DUF4190 domain-containing protein [Anaerosacchariphilus polymeriproducens]|uniref:DUF4190 domain-containing protein n=1 Tax=Anaerosacchariphilus polymeriproducens TaxID=1812858 RepID=A0A371ARW5_9FIRM|nr:DUF4190 domain-containing protein [Anaerosacchariphilus polymeriproducens]RDU22306.1 DUF4190 domain-containing protein [Anaerosacchariphilus polymeriproducens]
MQQDIKRNYSQISMVSGILSIGFSCTGFNIILGIIAIVLGILGRRTVDNKLDGRSIVGIITGVIGILLTFVTIFIFIKLINNPLAGLPKYWIK